MPRKKDPEANAAEPEKTATASAKPKPHRKAGRTTKAKVMRNKATRRGRPTAAVRRVRRARRRYSDADRQRILAAARSGNLTALQIKKRFGVTPVTYYSWR